MPRPSSLWLAVTLLFPLILPGCLLANDEAGIGADRGLSSPSETPAPEVAFERSDLTTAAGLFGVARPDDTPEDSRLIEGLESVMLGDFACVGRHLPGGPSGGSRQIRGRTVHFGTDIVSPGTSVLLLSSDGTELAEVVSDDRGSFEALVPDTSDASVASAVVWRPGYERVRYSPTHPQISFGGEVELGAVKPSDLTLVEAVAGVAVDDSRGSIVVRVFDCAGSGGVAGAHVAVEGAPADVYYASSRLELSRELDETTSTGQAYLFNLEPGVYTLAVWGFVGPGPEGAALLNRAVVEVGAGQLTVADVHPE